MKTLFDPCLRLLLQVGREGGFSNDLKDPGGITNHGVTKRQWESYVGRAVSENDMRALTIDTVTPFYKTRYWDVVNGDLLPAGVDHCVFDAAVNSGPGRATMLLQEAIGASIDGNLGPKTLAATKAANPDAVISAFTTGHLIYLKGLPGWEHDGGGWERRVNEVEQEALVFAKNAEEPLVA